MNLRNYENVLCDKTTKFHAHEIEWIHSMLQEIQQVKG
jgi:hypothetical protein